MSFLSDKIYVEEGDLVILYLSVNLQYAIQVRKYKKNKQGDFVQNKFQTVYGCADVMSFVGKPYGTKVELSKGWGYLLRPTCELWTKNLPHRTQIIYTPDISLIILQLNISSGSTVIEAGTGSGSLSHALIRAVHPSGHLYTYDFHQLRVQKARQEFIDHGLSNLVTCAERDVIADGFDVEVTGNVDGVFLDLPCPWQVVPHVQKSLRKGGRLCTFSPCIEQVQKTCETLKATGDFVQISTMEVLQRPLSVQSKTLNEIDLDTPSVRANDPVRKIPRHFTTLVAPTEVPGHTGYLTFATFLPFNRTG